VKSKLWLDSLHSALCTAQSLAVRLLPRNPHGPRTGGVGCRGAQSSSSPSSLDHPLHAYSWGRRCSSRHPTQSQGNGHSHCRRKVSSARREFGRSSTPGRPIVLVATPVAAAYPRSRSIDRLSHVELSLHPALLGANALKQKHTFEHCRGRKS
jgi:hypothetical protein